MPHTRSRASRQNAAARVGRDRRPSRRLASPRHARCICLAPRTAFPSAAPESAAVRHSNAPGQDGPKQRRCNWQRRRPIVTENNTSKAAAQNGTQRQPKPAHDSIAQHSPCASSPSCYWCLGAAAAKHVLFDHTINAGPIGLDLDGQLAVTGFGKRGAYHPLAVAGVKIGDVIVQVDGEAQPPGGLARPRTLPRRYREARARLEEDWPQRRRIRFRREVGEETAAPAPEPAADAGPTAAAGPTAPEETGPTQEATTPASPEGRRAGRGGHRRRPEEPRRPHRDRGAALAPFGAAPSCKERPAFVVDGDGCDPRALVGARGRVALVRRGGCGFAEKAYVAAAQGAFGVIVLETDAGRLGAEAPVATDEAFLARHPAARDVAVAVVGFEGAQQIRFALSEHAARRGVAARLVFGGCEGDKARPKDLGSVDAAEAEAAALVQAAFRPGAPRTFDFATHTLRGALWTLSGGVNETLGVVAAGARGLPARTEQLPARVVLADVESAPPRRERGAVVALAVRNCSCAGCSLHDVVPTLAAPAMVLLLPDDDDAPPRCAFSGAVPVASAPSGELLAALRRGASVALASTHPAPRLERTWRELEDLRDPANWPDDSRQRRRVRGAMRVCDDRATRASLAHLDARFVWFCSPLKVAIVAQQGGHRDVRASSGPTSLWF